MLLLHLNTKTLIFVAFLMRVSAIFTVIEIAVTLLFEQTKSLFVFLELLLLILALRLLA